jgi:signal transduction histidine kinase
VTQSSRTSSPVRSKGAPEVGDRAGPTGSTDWNRLVRRIAGAEIGGAASRIRDRLPVELNLDDIQLREHLLWVAQATRGAVLGAGETGATIVLRRRIVDLLRQDLVARWADHPPETTTMLDTLQSLEQALQACVPAAEQSLAAELTDQGGLDLVVEVAHDMRSPLTSILFLSEILHRGQTGALPDVQKRQIGIIYSAALGLVGMASDMIEMARGGNRLAAANAVPFSINEILHNVNDLVRPTAVEKRLDVQVECLASQYRIGHPIPLSRVLLNLTTNALKFTQEGTIEVAATPIGGNRVEFAVRDTGPGISDAAVATLYEPFRREPARETGYYFSGTGLGLAICRRLVLAMGSELQLETKPDCGTRFSFELDLPPAATL